MKAKQLISCAAILVLLAGSLIGCGGADNTQKNASDSTETITLRMGSDSATGNLQNMSSKEFCRLVEEKTDGKVVIEYYDNSQFGGDKELAQAVQAGTLDLGECAVSNFEPFSNKLSYLELPGLANTREGFRAILNSEFTRDTMLEIRKEAKISPIAVYVAYAEPRGFLYKGDEIRVPADCSGRVFRTTGSVTEVAFYKALGISGQSVAGNETYTALSQNMVEGTYIQAPAATTMKWTEPCDGFTYINESWVGHLVIMNPAVEDKLGEELMAIIRDCAREAETYSDSLCEESAMTARQAMLDEDINVIDLTDDEQKQWDDVCMSIWPQLTNDRITEEVLTSLQDIAASV